MWLWAQSVTVSFICSETLSIEANYAQTKALPFGRAFVVVVKPFVLLA